MVELTIQVLLLPAGVLGVAVARAGGRATVLLQKGLGSRATAAVVAQVIAEEEAQHVRP